LSRLTHDAKLIPEVRPNRFSIEALTSLTEEIPPTVDATTTETASDPISEPTPEPAPAANRRVLAERRSGFATFGGTERRSHPFGRRAQDRQ
jgi:hypothetical protein